MKSVTELRSQHPRFFYKKYQWHWETNTLTLQWHFFLEPEFHFHPVMHFPNVSEQQFQQISEAELHLHAFSIGLAEMLSYWKLTAAPEIIIEAQSLTPEQTTWWHQLLIQGMGEYFYINQIDFTAPDFVVIRAADSTQPTAPQFSLPEPTNPRILIPLGGGKDSAVTLELFRQNLDPANLGCLLINPTQAAQDIATASQLKTITVTRELDPLLLSLNSQGYLNGHVPISALFAFTSLLAARLHDYHFVPVSNERSSNEGNVEYLGREINHQYSKTFAFEKAFSEYISQFYPANSPVYFSYLRPLFELQIAKIFSAMKTYHPIFRSCNVGQKTNSWCGHCSKCLFAFIILYPFVNLSELTEYFGENLLDKPELLTIALELVGASEHKPFDCVGTHEESLAAFHLCWQKWQQTQPDSSQQLLQQVYKQVLSQEANLDERAQTILQVWNNHHLIPSQTWESWLKAVLQEAK